MEKSNFENLKVFQLSEQLADQIWNIVIFWNHLATDTVGKQIIRSADSIGANIAEGSGRYIFKIIYDLSKLLELLRMKQDIG